MKVSGNFWIAKAGILFFHSATRENKGNGDSTYGICSAAQVGLCQLDVPT
jgi:hypothetical protein